MTVDADTRRLEQLARLDELVGETVADTIQAVFERLLEARTANAFFECEREMHHAVSDFADTVVALGLQTIATDEAFEEEDACHTAAMATRARPV